MFNILIALALTVNLALEVKGQRAFEAGVCHVGFKPDDARKVSAALVKEARGLTPFEAGYLSALFDGGKGKALELGVTRADCERMFKDIING